MYQEMFKLNGRVALVTGGGRAIGLACVEALAESGAKVIIADFDEKVAAEGQAAMKAKGYSVETVMMDVTKTEQVNKVADDVVKRHGKIDILVNNAGIARSETPAEKVADEHWLNVIDVNLNGTFWCCRAFGKHMLEKKSGARFETIEKSKGELPTMHTPVQYDGGTQLGAIGPLVAGQKPSFYLLFTDGISNFGREPISAGVPV